jgi:DNA polymerase
LIAGAEQVKTAADDGQMTDPDSKTEWAEQLAAAQAWWREAGVDLAFADEPTRWLEKAGKPLQLPAEEAVIGPRQTGHDAPPPPPFGGDRAGWPRSLGEFAAWWLTEPTLDPAPAALRVPPAGPAGAALMVLVPMPEPDESAALLTGRQGRLLDAILQAFGFARDQVYLASILPRPMAAPDWSGLGRSGLGEVVAHHIALAAPQRLIVFGRDVSPLLGHDPAQVAQSSLRFNHEDLSVPLAFAPALDALLERPALKRGLWNRWLEWTGT